MSHSSHFKLNVTFKKGLQKDSLFLCNVTLQCCKRKELIKEDIEDLINQRFGKVLKAEEDFTYEYNKVPHHDHGILHDDGYENIIITISKGDSPAHKKDEVNQNQSLRQIKIGKKLAQS